MIRSCTSAGPNRLKRNTSCRPAPGENAVALSDSGYAANVEALRVMADAMPGTSANAMEEQLLGTVRPGVSNRPRRGRYSID